MKKKKRNKKFNIMKILSKKMISVKILNIQINIIILKTIKKKLKIMMKI